MNSGTISATTDSVTANDGANINLSNGNSVNLADGATATINGLEINSTSGGTAAQIPAA